MIRDYIAIARPDHWFKNVMLLPGFAIALLLPNTSLRDALFPLVIAVVAICLVASANYVINDWLDALFDRHHPIKKDRPTVLRKLSKKAVYTEYVLLSGAGLGVGLLVNLPFAITLAALWVQGLLYNVRPFRTKEIAYLDVLSESINNPIRLFAGWFVVTTVSLPPSSLIISYWMGGAFLMAVKRFAEYRFIDDPIQAAQYRRSFSRYTENSLLISAFFYGASSALFFGVFMVVHKIELIFSLPLLSSLFTWYLRLGMKKDSPAQRPEKLYRERAFLCYLLFVVLCLAALMWIELPFLKPLLKNAF